MVTLERDMQVALEESAMGGEGVAVMKALARVLPVNVRLLSEVTLRKGDSVGEHLHENESEIYVITEGAARYTDDGEEFVLHKGDTTVCPSGHTHAIANGGEGDLKFIAIIVME